jgi:hypothetical protein
MPTTPFIVSGIIKDSLGVVSSEATLVFTNSTGTSGKVITDSTGQYVFDLANIGYSSGETITYSIASKFLNENVTGTFVVSGTSESLSVSTSVRTDLGKGNTGMYMFNIGGKPVSSDNPFPVQLNAIITEKYDAVVTTTSGDTIEIYTFKTGGTSGTTVATITLTFTNSKKTLLSTVVRS